VMFRDPHPCPVCQLNELSYYANGVQGTFDSWLDEAAEASKTYMEGK
jgi:hypothetical protein